MPGFIPTRLNRQQFLRASTALIAASLVTRVNLLAQAAGGKSNRFALLSDTHIDGQPVDPRRETVEHLQAAVQQVLKSKFDMAMINGDAAFREGQAHDYRLAMQLLEPLKDHCPVAIGLGNHDDRQQFRKVFAIEETAVQKECNHRHVLIIESEHANWLMLDSLLYVNKVAGFLGSPQRAWLKRYLAESGDKPVLVMVHHTLGDTENDLLDARDLLEICKAAPQVKAVFYGHSHQYNFRRDGHLHLVNLPAVAYNFAPSEPVGWVAADLQPSGIKLQLHAFAGNRDKDGEVTELAWS
jgi:3',5'-cyclic AMP phosphodiesterase CpdA